MLGRKARRIAELETELARQAYLMDRQTELHRSLRAVIVRQRASLREMHRGLKRDRQLSRELADRARLAISRWNSTADYPDATRHDGNHPEGECDACDVFRALGPFGSEWHKVLRARYEATHR
jgi:hypothetical protein